MVLEFSSLTLAQTQIYVCNPYGLDKGVESVDRPISGRGLLKTIEV